MVGALAFASFADAVVVSMLCGLSLKLVCCYQGLHAVSVSKQHAPYMVYQQMGSADVLCVGYTIIFRSVGHLSGRTGWDVWKFIITAPGVLYPFRREVSEHPLWVRIPPCYH